MDKDVKSPGPAGAQLSPDGTSHVSIAVHDHSGTPRPSLDRGAQNSALSRIPTHASLLGTIDKRSQVVIRFQNVCAWVPTLVVPSGQGHGKLLGLLRRPCNAKADELSTQRPSKELQILSNISGEVNPGEVLALMGPSGGGKTSLLTLLAGRSTARLEGAITFNGAKMSKPGKRKLGYVMQDDLLYAELTVYETLYFAALLRLPRSWSRADKLARVEMVLEGLGLERCRDTIIGNHMRRGVSGGERKRVSIGHELLINPSMLLLDEPTSGLDSTTALRLLHTLRTLASGGRTIVTSIHQPSSRLYRQMDKLMLLAQGHTVYYGDAQCVATWFKLLGQPCPFGTNIADHILDLANGDVATRGTGASLRRRRTGAGTNDNNGSNGNGLLVDDDEATDGDGGAAGAPTGLRGGSNAPLTASGVRVPPGELLETPEEVHQRLVEAFKNRTIGLGRNGIRAWELEAAEGAGALPTSPTAAAAAAAAAAGADGAAQQAASGGGGTDASVSPCSTSTPTITPARTGVGGKGDIGADPPRSLSGPLEGVAEEGEDVKGDGAEAASSSRHKAAVAAAAAAAGSSKQAGTRGDGGGAGGGREDDNPGVGCGHGAVDKWGAPWHEQVKYLTLRSVKTRRFTSMSTQTFVQLIGGALLAGMLWWQRGAHLTSAERLTDLGGLLFFIELFVGYWTLYSALFTFPLEFQMICKERQSGMYRLSAYYVARTLSDLPMDCLLPSLFVWIVYWMTGLRVSAGAFFSHWAAVLLIVLTSQSVGLLIGATVINPQNGQAIATIFMLSTMLVGGYFVRGIPVWISWLKYLSFVYWGWNLVLRVEFRHLAFPCDQLPGVTEGDMDVPEGPCDVAQAAVFQANMDGPVTADVCVLIGMLIFLRLCIYFALQYKTTFKGRP